MKKQMKKQVKKQKNITEELKKVSGGAIDIGGSLRAGGDVSVLTAGKTKNIKKIKDYSDIKNTSTSVGLNVGIY